MRGRGCENGILKGFLINQDELVSYEQQEEGGEEEGGDQEAVPEGCHQGV